MKYFKIVLTLSLSLVGLGCTNNHAPSPVNYNQQYNNFNPNDKKIVFSHEKPYAIPRLAVYSDSPLTADDVKKYNAVGLSCNPGDLFWVKKSYKAESKEDIINGVKNRFIGCSYPLEEREYRFLLEKERQRDEAWKKLAGWDTPKIKVEHSGTINHNVYHY